MIELVFIFNLLNYAFFLFFALIIYDDYYTLFVLFYSPVIVQVRSIRTNEYSPIDFI